jgi:PIN domain nuclease of toxin-antitoxin system
MAGLVLDASVLIALYNDKDAHHKWAVDLMFQSPAETFHMSSMNLAEVAVQPMRLGIESKFHDGIRGLNIEISGLSQDAGFELARIRATTNVPMPDCCALQLVLEKDASLATCDKAQAKAAKALGIEVFQP